MHETRSLYAMKSTAGLFKVGIANDPHSRLKDVRCPKGGEVSVFFVQSFPEKEVADAERRAHFHLRHAHHNKEWFECGEQVVMGAMKQAARGNGEVDILWSTRKKNGKDLLNKRKIFSLSDEMNTEIEDLAHEMKIRSDAVLIRAALQMALDDKEKLRAYVYKEL